MFSSALLRCLLNNASNATNSLHPAALHLVSPPQGHTPLTVILAPHSSLHLAADLQLSELSSFVEACQDQALLPAMMVLLQARLAPGNHTPPPPPSTSTFTPSLHSTFIASHSSPEMI